MKNIIQKKAQILLFGTLVLFMSVMVGCKKEQEEGCTNFNSLGLEVTINGAVRNLSLAQKLLSTGFVGDVHTIQVGAFTSDCNELTTFSINLEIAKGAKLDGEYKLISSNNFPNLNEGSCSITEQKISTLSQTLVQISSGTMIVKDKGNKLYNFDINAKLVEGGTATLKGDVQF